MIYLYIWRVLVGLGIVGLLLMCVRLFAPDFIYVLRSKVLLVRSWRYSYEKDAGQNQREEDRYKIQIADIRVEAAMYDRSYTLRRVEKIRELYHALSILLKKEDIKNKEDLTPQLCIIEAANLVTNMAERLAPIPDQDDRRTIDAYRLLLYIYQNHQPAQDNQAPERPRIITKEEMKKLEEWFSGKDHLISIEQVTELLLAAVFGMVYRFKVQDEGKP
ncbi:MAG: hypothetical protein ABI977_14285 [Acidobacteriota bacterium]